MPIKAMLRGDSIDLSILAELYPEPGDPVVTADGSGYYLMSPTLPDSLVNDAGKMLARASELLRTINGAARVVSSSYRPVELSGTFRDSTDRQHVVAQAETAYARVHVFAAAVVTSPNGQPIEPPDPPAPKYIQLATRHPDVAEALTILGKQAPLDWFDLYKLYEIVRDNVDPSSPGQSRKGNRKKLLDTGWATDPDLRAFTGSANHQLASGDAARHAREPGSAPTRIMSLEEGAQFIRDLVSHWLSSFT
jgi:hypothetical protein